jgi:hypothetical protein
MSRVVLAVSLVLTSILPALAADQVLPGKKLALKETPTRASAVLIIQDPSIVLPAAGSPEDPSTAGLRVVLVDGTADVTAELLIPPGAGWSVKTGTRTTWTWKNAAAPGGPSPVNALKLVSGKGLTLKARSAGLSLTGPLGSVGVRVELGTTRFCTIFDPPAVRRDVAGQFTATKAETPNVPGCSDGALSGGAPCGLSGPSCDGYCGEGSVCGRGFDGGCECTSASRPCGGSSPACNGQCPDGETCADIGFDGLPFNRSCECLPSGSVGCGTTYPTCGVGDCPAGTSCFTKWFQGAGAIFEDCACSAEPPVNPCGSCPAGWSCGLIPPSTPACFPPS